MRRLSILLVVLCLSGCATRRVQVVPGQSGVLVEDTSTALSTSFADLEAILKSDLPAADKTKLVADLMQRRSELMDKLLARKEKQASNLLGLIHNVGLFITAVIAARVGI